MAGAIWPPASSPHKAAGRSTCAFHNSVAADRWLARVTTKMLGTMIRDGKECTMMDDHPIDRVRVTFQLEGNAP